VFLVQAATVTRPCMDALQLVCVALVVMCLRHAAFPALTRTCRLGPRKAGALLRAVTRVGGFVESRAQVWRELGVLGNCCFRLAAPYLRIRASVKGESGSVCGMHPTHGRAASALPCSWLSALQRCRRSAAAALAVTDRALSI
jgi:hypothetical protein